MRFCRRIIAVLSAVALLPLAVIAVAAMFAALLKCEVSDIAVTQCFVFGTDIGWLFSGALTIGWLGLITIPLLTVVVSLWALIEAFVAYRKRRKLRRAASRGAA